MYKLINMCIWYVMVNGEILYYFYVNLFYGFCKYIFVGFCKYIFVFGYYEMIYIEFVIFLFLRIKF